MNNIENKLQTLSKELKQLSKELGLTSEGFNIFDVLKITRTEIRHSNVLAWLLDPKGTHCLNDKFLRRFLGCLQIKYGLDFSNMDMDFSDAEIFRETENNIDILIKSDKADCVICIENKIDTKDHDNQLLKYWEYVENDYKDYKHRFYIYLTPNGDAPLQGTSAWLLMSYIEDINELLNEIQPSEETKQFIDHYKIVLKREKEASMNKKENTITKFYIEHKDILDFLFENKPDAIRQILVESQEKGFSFIDDSITKASPKFRTPFVEAINTYIQKNTDEGITGCAYYEVLKDYKKDDPSTFSVKVWLLFSLDLLNNRSKTTIKELAEKMNGSGNNRSHERYYTIWKHQTAKQSDAQKIAEELEGILVKIKEKENIFRNREFYIDNIKRYERQE